MRSIPTLVIYRAAWPREDLATIEGIEDPERFVELVDAEVRRQVTDLIAWVTEGRGAFSLPVPDGHYPIAAGIVADAVAVKLRAGQERAA